MDRVDLHFHVLPGLDDGPATMADALWLARAAVADGTSHVVATPHVRPDFVTDVAELPERVRELREALLRERIPLSVALGAELGHRMVGRLSQLDLETVALGPPGHRWLLLETPFAGIDDELRDAVEELGERGFGVVLAHPERSAGVLGRLLSRALGAAVRSGLRERRAAALASSTPARLLAHGVRSPAALRAAG